MFKKISYGLFLILNIGLVLKFDFEKLLLFKNTKSVLKKKAAKSLENNKVLIWNIDFHFAVFLQSMFLDFYEQIRSSSPPPLFFKSYLGTFFFSLILLRKLHKLP